jgi:hypothetical protein
MPPIELTDRPVNLTAYFESLKGREWAIALGMLLLRRGEGGAPLRPQLIAFHDMTPVQAIRWSVYAGDREPRPAHRLRLHAGGAHGARRR